jgi:hypothetical protein
MGGFQKITHMTKMLRICIYLCIYTSYYLKRRLNVQIFISADQIFAFFAQIEYLFPNRFSQVATAGFPVVQMSPKIELTGDQRKKLFLSFCCESKRTLCPYD